METLKTIPDQVQHRWGDLGGSEPRNLPQGQRSKRSGGQNVKTIQGWRRGNRLKGLVAACCLTVFAIGPWTLAVAQSYGGMSAEEDVAAERANSEADSSPARDTSDSGVSSTLEVPTIGTPDGGGSAQPNLMAAPPPVAVCPNCDVDPDASVGEVQSPNDVASYEAQRSEFDPDQVETSWIGLSLSRDRRELRSGGYADGLLVVGVQPDTPAAKAGLQPPIEGKVRTVLEIATLAAGMAFPPAMIGVAIVNSTHLGESYDMIIGVDGDRVMNIEDFEDRLRVVQPGETVYLNIVRNGIRLQIPVSIPPDMNTRYQCTSVPCSPPS